jgi:hypothetical protein
MGAKTWMLIDADEEARTALKAGSPAMAIWRSPIPMMTS